MAAIAHAVHELSESRPDRALQRLTEVPEFENGPLDALARGLRAQTLLKPEFDAPVLAYLGEWETSLQPALGTDRFLMPAEVHELVLRRPSLTALQRNAVPLRWKAPLPAQSKLTKREAELFTLLMGDLPMTEIVKQLQRSENTLKTHRRNLYRKLGVTSRGQLQAFGAQHPELWARSPR